jgi:hypothetical protein
MIFCWFQLKKTYSVFLIFYTGLPTVFLTWENVDLIRYWLLGPWHSWSKQQIPRLAPKPDPLIYDCLFLPAWLFLFLQNNAGTSSYSTSQAFNLFHLVIADNHGPETLSLPHGLAPPIKPTTYFQPSHCTLNLKRVTALWSGSNKSFFSTCGIVFIQQYLTLMTMKCYI